MTDTRRKQAIKHIFRVIAHYSKDGDPITAKDLAKEDISPEFESFVGEAKKVIRSGGESRDAHHGGCNEQIMG